MPITSIGPGFQSAVRTASSSLASTAGPAASPAAVDANDPSRRIALARQQVTELSEALSDFDQLAQNIRPKTLRAASVTSGVTVGLTGPAPPLVIDEGTPTVMRSLAEVNSTATSFTPGNPAWAGGTAQPTIGGVYLGTQGTGTLTFLVNREGTHGTDDIKIDVYDPLGNKFQTLDVRKSDAIDKQYLLSNGLRLQLGAGFVLKNDTFTVDVDAGVPTSFAPSAPAWKGSTATAAIGGVYDGSHGTDTLTFRVDREGTHGVDDLRVKVYDSGGAELEAIDIARVDAIDRVYTLSNGLEFTLGAGALLNGTSFTVDVDADIGTAVDPDRPMNGTGADDPRLEAGFTVTDGSFTVNGVGIAVSAGDSINDVLAAITASAAGVTGSFDAASERVVLTQKTPGAAGPIALGDDSSGFLAATKLSGAVAVPGADPTLLPQEAPIPLDEATLADFDVITSGDIRINGVTISIDAASDTLLDVLERINASEAGVQASLGSRLDRVSLVSKSKTDPISLDSGDTGFFAAVQIQDGEYRARRKGGVSTRRARELGQALERVSQAVNELFGDARNTTAPEAVTKVRAAVETESLAHAVGSKLAARLKTDFGVTLDFRPERASVFEFAATDQQRFERKLRSDPVEIRDFFIGRISRSGDGLVGGLLEVLDMAQRDLRGALVSLGPQGSLGLLVDDFA